MAQEEQRGDCEKRGGGAGRVVQLQGILSPAAAAQALGWWSRISTRGRAKLWACSRGQIRTFTIPPGEVGECVFHILTAMPQQRPKRGSMSLSWNGSWRVRGFQVRTPGNPPYGREGHNLRVTIREAPCRPSRQKWSADCKVGGGRDFSRLLTNYLPLFLLFDWGGEGGWCLCLKSGYRTGCLVLLARWCPDINHRFLPTKPKPDFKIHNNISCSLSLITK